MNRPKMKLDVVPLPVADVDRAKAFHAEQVGFHYFSDPDGNSWALQAFPGSLAED